jgi:hypothetical protein
MKKCSRFLAIKEMQIKLHWDSASPHSERLPSITQTTTNAGEDMGKWNTPTLLVESNMKVPQN